MASGRPKKINTSSSRAGGTKNSTKSTTRSATGKAKTASRSKRSKAARKNQMKDEIMVLFSFACALILILSNFHLAGIVGEKIKWFMFGLFGIVEYIFPIIIAGSLIFLVSNKELMGVAKVKTAAVYALTIFLSAGWQRISDEPNILKSSIGTFFTYSAKNYKGGGFFGGIICKLLSPLGFWGSMVMIIILSIICIILITEKSFIRGIVSMRQNGKRMVHAAKQDYDIYKEHSSERLKSEEGDNVAETEEEYLKRRRQEKEDKLQQRAAKKREQELKREEKEGKKARMLNKARGVTIDTVLPKETAENENIDIHEIKVDADRNDQYSDDIYDPQEAGVQPQIDLEQQYDAFSGDMYAKESTITQENEDGGIDTIEEAARRFREIEQTENTDHDEMQNSFGDHVNSDDMFEQSYQSSMEDQSGDHFGVDGWNQPEDSDFGSDNGIEGQNIDAAVAANHEENAHDSLTGDNGDTFAADAKDVTGAVAGAATVAGMSNSSNVSSGLDLSGAAGVTKATSGVATATASHTEAEKPKEKVYRFPPMNLLKKNPKMHSGNQDRENRETAMRLQQTLQNFGVKVTITDISCGPAVTRFELQPEQGVKVSKIVSLSDDIKLNLAAADIRIEAPIPGKAAIGIEVPNKEAGSVMLRELLETDTFKNHPSPVSFAAGKDIAGKTIVADIAKMPHLLIAGATGSGKSVCINTIIMSILYKAHPDEVKLIMIDPKVVELSVYNGIPHLMIPVVTDPKKASGALNWAVNEMTDRYQKFAKMNVRDLKGYNAKVAKMELEEGEARPDPLCQLVIIIDELADLMMVAPGEVEDAICRLAQLARAAGIHLVIATQRPSVNVITGLIKANVPSRIAFSVSSGVDSRTIIDMNGAEKLLGKGDMLFFPSGYPKPVRVQGAFVSDEEVGRVVDFLKDNMSEEVTYNEEITNAITSVSVAGPGKAQDERDAYFAEAGRFVIGKEKGSIGMLQRYYKIGFNRAARIMDQLADAHVVGPEVGTKPRKVIMTLEEFEEFLKKNN